MTARHKKAAGMFFAAAALAAIVFIFSNSLQPAEISGAVSGGMLNVINTWLDSHGFITISEHFLRKCAHLCEFGVLGILLSSAFYLLAPSAAREIARFASALAAAAAVAICDETIQYFVPGRACLVTDMLIDTLGAALGCTAIMILIAFLRRHRKYRKKRHDD